MIFKIKNIIEIDINFFSCCGYECCFTDGVLTVDDPGFVRNYPNDLKPYKSGTRQDGEGAYRQCQIAGESESDFQRVKTTVD